MPTLCIYAEKRPINALLDRICSYHFKDGVKDNEPTFFSWSSVYDFEDPNKKKYWGKFSFKYVCIIVLK